MINANSSPREQSEFNSAISYLNRLNYWYHEADFGSASYDSHRWYNALINIFKELSTEMSPDEINKFSMAIQEINPVLARSSQKLAKRSMGMAITPEVYSKLLNLELDLRQVMRESGLQLKMRDDASKALR